MDMAIWWQSSNSPRVLNQRWRGQLIRIDDDLEWLAGLESGYMRL